MKLSSVDRFQAHDLPHKIPESSESDDGRLSEVVKVPIASLRPSDSPRSAGEDAAHIRALAESEAALPPIIVMPATMRVIDGMHRLRAAELRGATEIDVRLFHGDEKDAFILAVESNIAHGLPLGLEDRKAAAERILRSHPLWSDRAIGAATGLSAKTVGGIRARSSEELPKQNVRIGRDGRARPLDLTEGRRLAARLMQENPSAPLRQIAAQAGVSLGTVSDVRKRLQRGEGPVPEGKRGQPEPSAVSVRPPLQDDAPAADQPSRGLMLRHLSRDPSMRLTEDGRALLRWLTVVAVRRHDWERLLRNVPAHRIGAVAALARSCSQTWQQVAEQLESVLEDGKERGTAADPGDRGVPAGLDADPCAGGRTSALESRGRSGATAKITVRR
ncbi:hypothetical protein GCM10010344_76740 [Streptomyces bluensis]|uniref:ParB/RepB/Spo0J family partition protein n=2 Tax=Streptomyces bluensis TaxID=33897 RepID=UPI0019CB9FCE|nr:hypothetical protein GCM10010344_76740 [Streptomyces bluensis]